ncbi:Hypothetical protein J6897_02934 [Nakaseomyces glabratus]
MVSFDSVSSSEHSLVALRNRIVGDATAKLDVYLGQNSTIFKELTSISASDDIDLQHLKLDILLILLNVDKNTIESLGESYNDVVVSVLQDIELPKTFLTNNTSINRKYIKLINMSKGYTECDEFPFLKETEQYLSHLIDKLLSDIANSSEIANTIELLTLQLQNGKNRSFLMTKSLKEQIESMLFKCYRKYAELINYKYMIRLRVQKDKKNNKYKPLSNKGLNSCISLPNSITISNQQDEKLLYLCLVLYTWSHKINQTASLWESSEFQFFISSFLKGENIQLKCAALEFLIAPYLNTENTWKKRKIIIKYLPYLVDLLNYQPLPKWFDIFETLTDLIELYNRYEPMNNPIIMFLSKSNMLYGILGVFFECMSLKTQNNASIKTLTKCVKFCAAFAANDEKYRALLLEHKFLLNNLEFGLELHLSLLNEFIEFFNTFKNGNLISSTEPFPCLYDSELCFEWLSLLKSFSRSVTALRTSLKRNKLPELLLRLLRIIHRITKECFEVGPEFLGAELKVMGQTLGTICNFVVEFSNLQPYLVKNGIIEIIQDLLSDPLINDSIEWNLQSRKNALQGCSTEDVKTNSLWVLRHLMYNCQNEEKLELLAKIPMETILEFVNDPSWPVQAQAFQLIRNLTSNSRKVVNILLENFKEVEYKLDPVTGKTKAIGNTYLFEFLVHKMTKLDPRDPPQKKTLEGILYIIVNLAAVNENKKQLVVEQDEILEILSEILAASAQNPTRYGNDSDLKLASLWVLNNLLWNSESANHSQFGLDGYPPTSRDSSSAPIDYSEPPSGRVSRNEIHGITSNTDHNSAIDEDIDDSSALQDNEERNDEFVRHIPEGRSQNNNSTVLRCKKLVDLGINELVKKNIFDDSLSVREKARTLSFHMDLLLRDSNSS